jgi:hypothetical protein
MLGDVRSFREQKPFAPSTIHLADGRHSRVPTRDHILAGRRVIVMTLLQQPE